ncbi:hypothetical protein ABZ914_27955 [Spirillospora sp. NPDC046719]
MSEVSSHGRFRGRDHRAAPQAPSTNDSIENRSSAFGSVSAQPGGGGVLLEVMGGQHRQVGVADSQVLFESGGQKAPEQVRQGLTEKSVLIPVNFADVDGHAEAESAEVAGEPIGAVQQRGEVVRQIAALPAATVT